MRAYGLIQKTRDGGELSGGEISAILAGYVAGEIPDYQMSAFLMAVYFRGMSPRETADFTLAMVRSGETLDLGAIRGTKVDKHSTGGAGGKTSLGLIPLAAAGGGPGGKGAGPGVGDTRGASRKTGARELAQAMVGIGAQVGRRTIALITDMDQPLGRAVGNALEVAEAIETLRGDGPMDLRELCLELGAQMVTLAGVARSAGEGKDLLMKILDDGSALAKFAQLVDAQGGDRRVVDDSRRLPAAPVRIAVEAPSSGVVAAVDAQALGLAAMGLGAGRATKDDRVDPAVGVVLVRKVGDPVRDGEPLADVHAPDRARAAEAGRRIQAAYRIAARAPASRPLIHGVIT